MFNYCIVTLQIKCAKLSLWDQITVETIEHAAAFAEVCNDIPSEGANLSNKK